MSPENVEVFKAAVGALATVVVGALAFLGVWLSSKRPSSTKPPTGDTGKALAEFNGTQNEFMAIVLADNGNLRKDMQEVKAEIRAIKEHQDTFLGAVRRYLMKLASAWGPDSPMPWPDDPDFHILEDTLPNRPDGRITARKDS